MRFFLGTHSPHHLQLSNVDMFVSRNRLKNRKTLPDPICEWALDSGGFTELKINGRWTISSTQYVTEVNRYSSMNGLQWAAPQDWMCEPMMMKKTGLTVNEHMRRTVDNLIDIRKQTPKAHVIPVLQGWNLDDYKQCFEMYESSGIDLRSEMTVGLGSVCRRQATDEIERIVKYFHSKDLRLHGFGVKTQGFGRYSEYLQSADSMAWSFDARYGPHHCTKHKINPTTKNCANCLDYALEWRDRALSRCIS